MFNVLVEILNAFDLVSDIVESTHIRNDSQCVIILLNSSPLHRRCTLEEEIGKSGSCGL